MSKTAKETKTAEKKLKKKVSGFDIMYRTVTALLAAAVFPVAYFLNLIYFEIDSTKMANLINKIEGVFGSENILEGIKNLLTPIAGSAEQAQEITYDYICLAKLDRFENLLGTVSSGDGTNIKDMLLHNAAFRPLVVSLVLFAAVLVLALVVLIISIIKSKPKFVASLSGAGIILGIISYTVFEIRFANPLMNGTVSLTDLTGSDSMILSIAQQFVSISAVRYSNAFFFVLFLMGAILIWSLSVMIVNSDDKTEKAIKKAKKAEKKAKKAQKDAKKAEKKAKDEAKDAEKKAKKANKLLKEEKEKEENSAQADEAEN